MISRGESEMLVEVELSDGSFVSRKKRRDRPYDLNVEVPHPHADTTGHPFPGHLALFQDNAQEEIWRRIGFSADDLLHTAYSEQKQLDALVAAKGSVLQDVVTGWLRLEPLVDAADAAGVELKAFSSQLLVVEEKLADVRKDPALGWDLSELRSRITELELQAKDEERRRKANSQRITEHDAWLVLNSKWQSQGRARAEAASEILRLESSLAELPLPQGEQLQLEQAANLAARAADATEVEWRQKRSLAGGLFDGNCPVNGGSCPIAVDINADRKRNELLLREAAAARAAAQVELAKQRAPLAEHVARRQARERLEARLEQARHSLRVADRQELPLLPEEPDVAGIVEGVGVSLELDELLRRKLLAAEGCKAKEQELLGLAAPLRLKIPVARAALAVLGPEGAQKRVAERAVQAIERVANRDLTTAGVALSLAVRWGRETKQPARQCPQCGSAFQGNSAKVCAQCLAPRGMQFKPELRVRLSNVSGAATDLAGLAFRCAAFKWLRAKRQVPWSVAVLDEPFGSLDVANKRALAAHVQALVASTFDQAFVVAHDRALLDGLQKRIVVTGRGDWSTVAVAT